MKLIGRTKNEGYLVEFTSDEYAALDRLERAATGSPDSCHYLFSDGSRREIDYGFAGVFGAIEAFTLAKFRLNQLQEVLDRFKAHLEKTG